MNRFENWFCASAFWRRATRRHLLPWMIQGFHLGEHILELGAGPGAATHELLRRSERVTSLDCDHKFAVALNARANGKSEAVQGVGLGVVQGDAATLPFPDRTFSSAIAVLVLHHLRSVELQDRAFCEIARVLRPGGVFLALEIQDGWLHRAAHFHSTFAPLVPASVSTRLSAAGFSRTALEFRRRAFALRAIRADEAP